MGAIARRLRARRGCLTAMAVALALVAGGYVVWVYLNHPPVSTGGAVHRSYPGGEAVQIMLGDGLGCVDWSPDGKMLAVSWSPGGRRRLRDVAQSQVLPDDWGQPRFSHLGRWVAGELLVVRASDGVLVRRFGDPANTAYWPGRRTWLPDSSGVLVNVTTDVGARLSTVFRCNVADGTAVPLVVATCEGAPVVSPDGARFVLRNTRGGMRLYTSGGTLQSSPVSGPVGGVVWLPGGDLLFHGQRVSGKPWEAALLLLQVPQNRVAQLTDTPWLPLGEGRCLDGMVAVWRYLESPAGGGTVVGVLDLRASAVRWANCGKGVSGAALALGGRLVVSNRAQVGGQPGRGYDADLWALRMSDGGWLRLTTCGDAGGGAMSPDGKRVAFDTGRGDALWVMTLDEKAIMCAKPASFKNIVTEPFLTKVPRH